MMLFDAVRQEIFAEIQAVLAAMGATDAAELVLEIPPEQKLGDFAFPAFRLAKALRKAPPVISKEIVEKLQANSKLAAKYEILTAGPYVNFRVKREVLLKEVLGGLLLSGDRLGEKNVAERPNVVLEFSSPNVAKPFNIYHLRSTMIGNCLHRIYNVRGFKSVAINHLGDWGSQYGTLAVAYEKWGDDRELEKRGIEYLVELYIRINKDMENDPALVATTREYFSRLERGDEKIKVLWQKFVALSIDEFKRTYARLNVEFDHFWGESFYIDKVPALEKQLQDKKLLVESEGAHVVMLGDDMPPCIIRKKDGSTIYATRDLAAAIYRQEKFHFSKCVYVVGGEQKLHFAQVFKVLELMGFSWAKNCIHVPFGLYRFKDQKMSTRKGNFVTMEAVLDHAVERVEQIMSEKAASTERSDRQERPFTAEERAKAAEIIGSGAIIFNDLSTDRNTDVNFDLERVLDFEGETGPYIQYAHTRCLSILRNSQADKIGLDGLYASAQSRLKEVEEIDLIRMLARLPLILDSVLADHRPSLLATYLIDITKSFNTFYRAHKVLVDDQELARARLALVVATQRTLLKGLTLLGMRVPDRM
jgi:arginyl-tRNA synthetase